MQSIAQTTIDPPAQALVEEFANTLTHGVGLVLSLTGAAAMMLVVGAADLGLTIGCGVYAATLVAVYALSTLSHAVQRPRARHLLRVWDQGVIYLLIAGSYTPFVSAFLSAHLRSATLSVIWTLALIGFFSKVVNRHRVNAIATHSYVLLGWVPALALVGFVPLGCLAWIVVGGLTYTLGTLFLLMDNRFRFFHATWHMLVVAASASHYYAIITYVVLQDASPPATVP